MKKPGIAYYVSAHGFGHGVRSCDIIRAFNGLYPDVPVNIVSGLPADFFASRLSSPSNRVRNAAFDVGMVQLDSVRVDVEATLKEISALLDRKKELVEEEAEFLRREGVSVVAADIPGIPLAAAGAAGIHRLAVGNFSWDWIYAPFVESDARWAPVVEEFRSQYAMAELLVRLPFSGDMSAFSRATDIGLQASPGRNRREEIAAGHNITADRPWVLLAFTSLDWDADALGKVAGLTDYELLTVRPLEWKDHGITAIDRDEYGFPDILASVDVVVSKPGYGIVTECIANARPLVYTDRQDFVEYPVLVEGIRRFLKNTHIPSAKLYRGELRDALQEIADSPDPPESLPRDGAEQAARIVGSYYTPSL